jgi:hypothetical protein
MSKINLAGKWKDAINNLQNSFYESEINLQDQQINKTPSLGYTSNSINSVIPLATPSDTRANEELLNMFRQTKIGTLAPVVNTYLQNKTPEQYSEDQQGQLETFGGILPAIGKKIGARAFKFGNQFVDNIPGLSSMSTVTNDKADDIAGAAIQAGGRVLPILGAAWYGINAGPTAAGTLDDARKKGLIR